MGNPFSRRAVLRSGSVAAVTALAGCQWNENGTTPGHIYAENGTDNEHRLDVVVGERLDGSLQFEIQARYRVPANHALEFNGVLDPDRRHVVRAKLSDAPPQDRISATIDQCDGSPAEARVVSIDVQTDGLGIITRDCQDSYSERDVEYVSASEYRVESIDGRLTPAPAD